MHTETTPIAAQILHEDEQIIVLHKQVGQPVIPGRGFAEEDTLIFRIRHYLKANAYVVHRLDKDTSGVLLFAKTQDAHRCLSLQFERREVHKVYLAVVQGIVECDGQIQSPILQFGSGRMGVHPNGQPSLTDYRVVKAFETATLLNVLPKTGRRHQIRVHLYSIGHSVLGDRMYGQNRPIGGVSRLMLHAHQISFRHPSGDMRTFRAEPGNDWVEVINSIK